MNRKQAIKLNENNIRNIVKSVIKNVIKEETNPQWDPYESAIQFIYNYGLGFEKWYNLNYLENYMDKNEALKIYQSAVEEMRKNGYDEQGQRL